MPSTCPECKQPLREGAAFCQSCGARIGGMAEPAVRPGDGGPRLPDAAPVKPARAPLVGGNQGKTLMGAAAPVLRKPEPAPAPAPVAPAAAPSRPSVSEGSAHVICPDCGTPNKVGMNFCKMCGAPLRAGASPSASMPSPLAAVVGTGPTARTAAAAATRTCPSCGKQTPASFAFCQHCGNRVPSQSSGPTTLVEDPGTLDTLTGTEDVVPLVKKRAAETEAAPPWAHLVSVLRDGSEGEAHPLREDVVDIGRSEGHLLFADDKFLARRHARVERRGAATVIQALDGVNGVYVRVRSGEVVALAHGDLLLLGKQVLRFEVLEPEERALKPAVQQGVRLFGSPLRSAWGRLAQIEQSGIARDVFHLVATEVVVGREEGDLRLPDDEFMSRRHVRITNRDGRFELVDLESSNGTYVRLRGERALKPGDQVRVGDQLFRFAPVS